LKPLLIIDFDSTFIKDETLDEVAKLLSTENSIDIKEKIIKITHQAMEGEIDFSSALKERVNLLKIHKTKINDITEILKKRVSDSFLKNKSKIRSIKNQVHIISGGFKEIINPIVEDFGIPESHVFANEFTYDKAGFINGINTQSDLSYSDGKIRALKKLDLKNGAYVIGDGSTDLEMKQVDGVSAFICFTENIDRTSVSEKADYIASNLDQVFNIIDNKK
tara:strand:- start:325 stop:987 length:663 start_codon:yes stop_codon:yes gene_type:complete